MNSMCLALNRCIYQRVYLLAHSLDFFLWHMRHVLWLVKFSIFFFLYKFFFVLAVNGRTATIESKELKTNFKRKNSNDNNTKHLGWPKLKLRCYHYHLCVCSRMFKYKNDNSTEILPESTWSFARFSLSFTNSKSEIESIL